MNGRIFRAAVLFLAAASLLVGCKNEARHDESAEAPPKAVVEKAGDGGFFKVDHPEEFALVAATEHPATSSLNVTGTVAADISRTIPVISLANGRVVAVHARLGDTVHKGQLLMEVQSTDVSGAFDLYLKAVNDERLASIQLSERRFFMTKVRCPSRSWRLPRIASRTRRPI